MAGVEHEHRRRRLQPLDRERRPARRLPTRRQRRTHHLADRAVEHRRVGERRARAARARGPPRSPRRPRAAARPCTTGTCDTPNSRNRPITSRTVSSGWTCTSAGRSALLRASTSPTVCPLAAQEAEVGHPLVVVELRQVAAAGVGDEHDDDGVGTELAADLERRPHRGAARAADEDALLARHPAGGEERVAVADLDDPVDDRRVVGVGPEVLADALDEVGPAGCRPSTPSPRGRRR